MLCMNDLKTLYFRYRYIGNTYATITKLPYNYNLIWLFCSLSIQDADHCC